MPEGTLVSEEWVLKFLLRRIIENGCVDVICILVDLEDRENATIAFSQ